jgi:hypothetical protein
MNLVPAQTIQKEATPLENELMAFVESHPEAFSPVSSMHRNIIRAFAMMDGTRGQLGRLGVGGLFDVILAEIATKIKRGINTTQDVNNALANFELCIEFVDKFLKKLMDNEPAFETKEKFDYQMRFKSSLVKPPIPARAWQDSSVSLHVEHSIWNLAKCMINDYNSRVLKLWADLLIKQNIIDPTAMQERMRTDPNAPSAILRTFSDPAHMNLETLLNVLTFIHLTEYFPPGSYRVESLIQRKQALRDLFLTHGDGLLVNRFVELNDRGIRNGLIGTHIQNDLNDLQLKCNVIGTAQSLPVQAYLSSDVLDQCVQRVGHFPTTEQFIQYMNTRMIEKAAAFAAHPPPPSAAPLPSAPPFEMDDDQSFEFSDLLSPSFFESSNTKSEGGTKRKRTKRNNKNKKFKSRRRR